MYCVLTGVLTNEKDVTDYGCGTQKETNQGKERAQIGWL